MLKRIFSLIIFYHLSYSLIGQKVFFRDTVGISHSKYNRIMEGIRVRIFELRESDYKIVRDDNDPYEMTPKRDSILEKYHYHNYELIRYQKDGISEMINPHDLFVVHIDQQYEFEFPYIEYSIERKTLLKKGIRILDAFEGASQIFKGGDDFEIKYYDWNNNLLAIKDYLRSDSTKPLSDLSDYGIIEINYCNSYKDKLTMRFYFK